MPNSGHDTRPYFLSQPDNDGTRDSLSNRNAGVVGAGAGMNRIPKSVYTKDIPSNRKRIAVEARVRPQLGGAGLERTDDTFAALPYGCCENDKRQRHDERRVPPVSPRLAACQSAIDLLNAMGHPIAKT